MMGEAGVVCVRQSVVCLYCSLLSLAAGLACVAVEALDRALSLKRACGLKPEVPCT